MRWVTRWRAWVGVQAVFCAVALSGCGERLNFEVELRPDGAQLQRTLTVARERENGQTAAPTAAELEPLVAIYGARQNDPQENKAVFHSSFSEELPADLGGEGSYVCWPTRLGTAYTYVERLRGEENFEAHLIRRRAAADRLTDFVLLWFEQELGQEPGFDRLRAFIHADFRRDLRNVIHQTWMLSVIENYDEDAQAELVARITLYATRHGYLRLADVPVLTRALRSEPQSQLIGLHVARWAAGQMGIDHDAPLPPAFEFLTDVDRLQTSLERAVRASPEYERLAEERRLIHGPQAAPPTTNDVLQPLIVDLIGLRLFGRLDEATVRLAIPGEPYEHNGAWNAEDKMLEWTKSLDAADPWPALLQAQWSEPNESEQRERLGGVKLTGADLAEYVTWERGLTAEEAAEWDRFVSQWQPGPGLHDQIAAFRFAAEETLGLTPPQSQAEPARAVLLRALQR